MIVEMMAVAIIGTLLGIVLGFVLGRKGGD